MDQQPHLWPEQWVNVDDANRAAKSNLWWYENMNTATDYYTLFASSLVNVTNIGIFRQLGMRMNSSSTCINEDPSDFPATCFRERPFASDLRLRGLDIRICAPGDYEKTPWMLSRDSQDIPEELWIDLTVDPSAADVETMELQWGLSNFTLHCTVNTSRGYFEIPNLHTKNNPGPLLEKWPSEKEMAEDWNDYLSVMYDYAISTAW